MCNTVNTVTTVNKYIFTSQNANLFFILPTYLPESINSPNSSGGVCSLGESSQLGGEKGKSRGEKEKTTCRPATAEKPLTSRQRWQPTLTPSTAGPALIPRPSTASTARASSSLRASSEITTSRCTSRICATPNFTVPVARPTFREAA